MDELKKSLEVILTTVKELSGKDQLVIFLFVRNVLDKVESCLATDTDYDIDAVFTECCTVFQEADDVLVESKDDGISVETMLGGQITRSYKLIKDRFTQTQAIPETEKVEEPAQTVEDATEDGAYYLSVPSEDAEDAEGEEQQQQQPQQPEEQTVLECSNPSVLQAFLEEGGKLPSYLPPGTQIIIETEDGRTEVIGNAAAAPSAEQTDAPSQESVAAVTGTEIPTLVMTEGGEMLMTDNNEMSQLEAEVMASAAALEADNAETPTRGRKRQLEGAPIIRKKLKVETLGTAVLEGDEEPIPEGQATADGLQYQCDKCFQYFAHEHSLHRHYRAVHMNMKWTCEDCGREFTRPDSLVNHRKRKSCFKGPGKPGRSILAGETYVEGQGYLCKECDMYFKHPNNLRKHRETQHNTQRFQCDDCGKLFLTKDYLAIHQEKPCKPVKGEKVEGATGEEAEVAGDSESTADLDESAKKAKREKGEIVLKEADNMYLCEDCGLYLGSRQSLQNHIRKHTGEVPFKCQFCGHGANTRANILRHIENIHGVSKDDPNIKLDLTNKSAVHVRSHTKELPFTCDYCDKGFITKANKIRHETTIHLQRKDFKCDICDKSFTEKKTLLNHQRTIHDGERPYQCHICDKTFTQKGALQSHITTHTGEGENKCDYCDRSFARRYDWKKHLKDFHRDKLLECVVCAKTWVTDWELDKHLESHEDFEKICQLCGDSLRHKQEMTDHIKQKHTKEKAFKCDICDGVSFYTKRSLDKHYAKEHPDFNPNIEIKQEPEETFVDAPTAAEFMTPQTTPKMTPNNIQYENRLNASDSDIDSESELAEYESPTKYYKGEDDDNDGGDSDGGENNGGNKDEEEDDIENQEETNADSAFDMTVEENGDNNKTKTQSLASSSEKFDLVVVGRPKSTKKRPKKKDRRKIFSNPKIVDVAREDEDEEEDEDHILNTIDTPSRPISAALREDGTEYPRTPTGRWLCDVCNLDYSSKGLMQRHYRAKHTSLRYKCGDCGAEFARSDSVKVHLKNACPKAFPEKIT